MSTEVWLILFYGTAILVLLGYLSYLLASQNRALEALLAARESGESYKVSTLTKRLEAMEQRNES